MLKNAQRRQQGFTLLEAMVTITVLALLLGVLVPGVADWIQNISLRATAESVKTGLQRARSEALQKNRLVVFSLVTPATAEVLDASCALSSASGSWVVSLDNPAGLCDVALSATVAPRTVEAQGAGSRASNLTVAALGRDGTTSASQVTFNAFGQAMATGTPIATVDVTSNRTGTRRLRVVVSPGGSIRMCDRDVDSTDPRAC